MRRDRQWLAHVPGHWPGWVFMGLILMGLMTLAGGLLGSVLFPVVGSLLGMDLTLPEMAGNGFRDGAFYAFIWAPGASFVAVVMAVHEKRKSAQAGRG